MVREVDRSSIDELLRLATPSRVAEALGIAVVRRGAHSELRLLSSAAKAIVYRLGRLTAFAECLKLVSISSPTSLPSLTTIARTRQPGKSSHHYTCHTPLSRSDDDPFANSSR